VTAAPRIGEFGRGHGFADGMDCCTGHGATMAHE
jgi:hypothetical protein